MLPGAAENPIFACMSDDDSTRRDRRHPVAPGRGWVTFTHPVRGTTAAAALTRLSVSGLAFAAADAVVLEPGMLLPETTIRIGRCEVRGEVLVKSVPAAGDGERQIGGLFYPENERDEERVMTLIAGAAAVKGG